MFFGGQRYRQKCHTINNEPGTPAYSTTKTGRHDIVEILLKVALNTKNINQSNHQICVVHCLL
jgi:hypothetical protein